jgi:syntaxin 1A
MTRDRFAELQKLMGDTSESVTVKFMRGRTGRQSAKGGGDGMKDIFAIIDEITEVLDKAEESMNQVKTLQNALLTDLPSSSDAAGYREALEVSMQDVKKNLMRARLKLKEMGSQLESDNEERSCEQAAQGDGLTADMRIRLSQHAALSRRLVSILTSYNSLELDYKRKCTERIRKQLYAVNSRATPEELDEIISNPNPAIFTQNILVDSRLAKEALQEVKARHADILKIEESIGELNDLFVELAVLVEQQGEKIDIIEHNVSLSGDKVEAAVVSTNEALKNKRKYRRRKVLCAIICFVVLVVVVILIILSVCIQIGGC